MLNVSLVVIGMLVVVCRSDFICGQNISTYWDHSLCSNARNVERQAPLQSQDLSISNESVQYSLLGLIILAGTMSCYYGRKVLKNQPASSEIYWKSIVAGPNTTQQSVDQLLKSSKYKEFQETAIFNPQKHKQRKQGAKELEMKEEQIFTSHD